jgi:deoxyadenosine/deoxycytidine kinase
MSSSNKKFTIAVEGNIGSGKSTVLAHLATSSLCDVIVEPIDNWTNFKGHNILQMFYDDPHRWGFAFEVNAQRTLAKLHAQPTAAPVKVMERSIHSTRYCFVEHLYQSEILQHVEYEMLNDLFQMFVSDGSCKLDLIIYLQATPETCFERIQARHRSEEESIDLDYLRTLHTRHEIWLTQQNHTNSLAPVLIVDANQPEEKVYSDTFTYVTNLVSR